MSEINLSRRDFARAAGGAAVGACLAGTAGAASAAEQAQPPNQNQDAQHLYDMLRARYGKHLDNDQWQRVRTQIEGQVRAARSLREFQVGHDDPDFVFVPEVG